MAAHDYRRHLRAVVAASAAPHGYTLTLWTTGAIATHSRGQVPSSWEALILLAGAAAGFVFVGLLAFGDVNGILDSNIAGDVRVWGGIHLPSVGLSILIVTGICAVVKTSWVWPLVGFAATTTYLLVIGVQFWLATHKGVAAAPVVDEPT